MLKEGRSARGVEDRLGDLGGKLFLLLQGLVGETGQGRNRLSFTGPEVFLPGSLRAKPSPR